MNEELFSVDAPDDNGLAAVRVLAARIRSNRQLRHMIKNAEPDMRRAVYDMIVPHLKFKPLSYLLLKP